jgi:phosphoglycerate dehydrogenase-like enzyme
MAPGLVSPEEHFDGKIGALAGNKATVSVSVVEQVTLPNVYLLEEFPSEAVQYCQAHFNAVLPTDSEIKNWRKNADAILVREKSITSEDISKCVKLKAIGKQGTGIDIIDQDACKAAGIEIFNTPGVNADTVAEMTLCLALAVARQIRPISAGQALGREVRKEHCCGQLLQGSCVGVVGMGAIGKKVAQIFRNAFGCTIHAYDPFLPSDAWADLPHHRVASVDEMLPAVDVLSLHVPLLPSTRGMIGMAQLSKMKSTAILLNCARGGLVVEDDLIAALQQGIIWGAGLDCHDHEPPTLSQYDKLWSAGNVVSTPHIGATCRATQVKTAMSALDFLRQYFELPSGETEKKL